MLFLLYLIVKVAARLLAIGRSNGSSRDLEILVLQHQVRILQRKAGRPRLRPLDRAVMAAASRILPRKRWVSFIVTPQTILRWHRELGAAEVDVRTEGESGETSDRPRGP